MHRQHVLPSMCWLGLAILLGFAGRARSDSTLPAPTDATRQFDFWLGDWKVRNRHLQPDGSWRDGGVAHAQIRSVLAGRAVVEQWNGQNSLATRGFSLRTYDAQQGRWEIVLNWHSGTPSTFSYMVGNFDTQRGEFFPPAGPKRTRFTFSNGKTTKGRPPEVKYTCTTVRTVSSSAPGLADNQAIRSASMLVESGMWTAMAKSTSC